MILGVDLDNTLIRYDGLFHAAAVARGMMPADGPLTKRGVRAWLANRDREADFTLLQGEVYGPGLAGAEPYPGALDCLRRLLAEGAVVYVISHKTGAPFLGPAHDLRRMAMDWLETNGFVAPGVLARDAVFFTDTLAGKAVRAAGLGCTHFVDDMAQFFLQGEFPASAEKLWFVPPGEDEPPRDSVPGLAAFASWREIGERLAAALKAERR